MIDKRIKLFFFLWIFFLPSSLKAAEGASGIYVLGAAGPLTGFLPPPGFYLRHDDYFYNGRIDAAPLGGGRLAWV